MRFPDLVSLECVGKQRAKRCKRLVDASNHNQTIATSIMATMADRVNQFESEQVKAVTASFARKPMAIVSEVKRFQNWLEYRQDIAIAEDLQCRLFRIVERYNRTQIQLARARSVVSGLLALVAKLPADKLFRAIDQAQVAKWMAAEAEDRITSNWALDSIDHAAGTISLVSLTDPSLWKEDVLIEASLLKELSALIEQGAEVELELDDHCDAVLTYTALLCGMELRFSMDC